MKNNGNLPGKPPSPRCSPRVHSVREITISYEGQNEEIVVKPPNLSTRGMFINTSRTFPEGAVLNLRFNLVLTNAEVRTRCEVRYCQAGVGVGVEFIGLSPEATKMIEREIVLSGGKPTRSRTWRQLKKVISRTARKRGH
ncbi:MAG: PilZ domain-containing protein [Candidatus Acidiferrum sp.]